MHAARNAYALIVIALALMACQQLGLAKPQTFEDKLAYAYSQNAALRKSASDALNAKVITVKDAEQVLATTDTARAALDEARTLACSSRPVLGGSALGNACLDGSALPPTALGKLELAQSLLNSVSTFLQSHGVK